MNFKAHYFSYRQTGAFSKIIIDYIEGNATLRPFYNYTPDIEGIQKAVDARNTTSVNREVLVQQLQKQYKGITASKQVLENISSLLNSNTYTVCTAHQPNIFTGHLYFIYKIMHVIKLADALNENKESMHFVPVFYMGSEDADLAELGEITINGKKYKWNTNQKGAVGRMKVDRNFVELIDEISGQISIDKFGNEIINILKKCYIPGRSIEQATLLLLNELFGSYGLVVLLPDNQALKKLFIPVMEKELTKQFSHAVISKTIADFPKEYNVQAVGRPLNLFYLKDDIRERIEASDTGFVVANTNLAFSQTEMMDELHTNPDRFSPNVILRPIYQEMILPNIAFIGGGGELAYWLELKKVFESVHISLPVLILRNSFMVVNKKVADAIIALNFTPMDFFNDEESLISQLIEKGSGKSIHLDKERVALAAIYDKISSLASAVDSTLQKHIAALSTHALHKVMLAEKKMKRAEKKKYEAQIRHIKKIKAVLFSGGILQERVDNLLPGYAIWGMDFLNAIYTSSLVLNNQFCILEEGI